MCGVLFQNKNAISSAKQIGLKEDELDTHIQAAITSNGENLCIYFQRAGEETLDIDRFDAAQDAYFGWWYNPQNGKFYTTELEETTKVLIYKAEDHKLKIKTLPRH